MGMNVNNWLNVVVSESLCLPPMTMPTGTRTRVLLPTSVKYKVWLTECSSRDKVITDSWQRCLADYKLDPVVLREPYILPGTELKEHRERLEKLIRTARYGLELLYKQIAQQNYVLLLTDAEGVTVDFMGDASIEMSLRKAGLYLGAEWSESRAGTCGVVHAFTPGKR